MSLTTFSAGTPPIARVCLREVKLMAIPWLNRWHKGFNRVLLGVALLRSSLIFSSYNAGFIDAAKAFIVTWGVGHVVFLVIYWIIKGFRKE